MVEGRKEGRQTSLSRSGRSREIWTISQTAANAQELVVDRRRRRDRAAVGAEVAEAKADRAERLLLPHLANRRRLRGNVGECSLPKTPRGRRHFGGNPLPTHPKHRREAARSRSIPRERLVRPSIPRRTAYGQTRPPGNCEGARRPGLDPKLWCRRAYAGAGERRKAQRSLSQVPGGPRRGLPGRSGASLRALPREGMPRTDPSKRRRECQKTLTSSQSAAKKSTKNGAIAHISGWMRRRLPIASMTTR